MSDVEFPIASPLTWRLSGLQCIRSLSQRSRVLEQLTSVGCLMASLSNIIYNSAKHVCGHFPVKTQEAAVNYTSTDLPNSNQFLLFRQLPHGPLACVTLSYYDNHYRVSFRLFIVTTGRINSNRRSFLNVHHSIRTD